jgi:hypothetical protein
MAAGTGKLGALGAGGGAAGVVGAAAGGGAAGGGAAQATYFRPKPPGFMANRPIDGGLPDYTYRRRLWVDTNPANGEVVLRCVATDIVRIRPNGDIVLTTGGYFTVGAVACVQSRVWGRVCVRVWWVCVCVCVCVCV